MRVGVVIQARLSSKRLPSKVLRSLHGRPMLAYLIERLTHASALSDVLAPAQRPRLPAEQPAGPTPEPAEDRSNNICENDTRVDNDLAGGAWGDIANRAGNGIIVATSNDASDDPLETYCHEHGIACYRGSLRHVAERCCTAAQTQWFDAFFRVCADSPLLDVGLFAQALALTTESGEAWDIITNVAPRSFPPGQSVELIRTTSLARILPELNRPDDREHVTRFFYKHPERFAIRNFCATRSYGQLRFTVDNPADLHRTEKLLSTLARNHWTYGLDELVERLRLLEALEVKLSGADL